MSNTWALIKRYAWGFILLAAVIVVSLILVRSWKARNPGAMTVLQAQGMDMAAMEPQSGPVPVATEVVHAGSFVASVSYTGSVAPFQEQVIYPRVEGWLADLNVYSGDTVKPSQILAVVNSPDLQTRAAEASAGYTAAKRGIPIAQSNITKMKAEQAAAQSDIESATGDLRRAEGMLSAARKTVAQARQSVISTRANADYWKAEIAREGNLYKAGAVSLQEYQSEQAQATAAEAESRNQEAKLAEVEANASALEGDVTSRRAAVRAARHRASAAAASAVGSAQELSRITAMASQASAAAATARIISDYRYLRAPFAGTITERYTSSGQYVNSGTAVMSVVQIDTVRLQANVADTDIPSITAGAPVTATLVKYPGLRIHATVSSVSPSANQKSRTAVVEAIVSNPKHRMVPGDSVTLSIVISRPHTVITVPITAVTQKNGESAVWVVRQGNSGEMKGMPGMPGNNQPPSEPMPNMKTAHMVMVTTGATNGSRVEILSGLIEGDEVIYQGNRYLQESDEVFPTQWGSEEPATLPKAKPMPGMGNMPGMK